MRSRFPLRGLVPVLLAAAVAAALAATPATAASGNANCVAQFVLPGAHAGRYGEVVRFLADEFRPLGVGVSANARSPKDACLVAP